MFIWYIYNILSFKLNKYIIYIEIFHQIYYIWNIIVQWWYLLHLELLECKYMFEIEYIHRKLIFEWSGLCVFCVCIECILCVCLAAVWRESVVSVCEPTCVCVCVFDEKLESGLVSGCCVLHRRTLCVCSFRSF